MSKKRPDVNPAETFFKAFQDDSMKAGLMMGYELGKKLKGDINLITSTLLKINTNLAYISERVRVENDLKAKSRHPK